MSSSADIRQALRRPAAKPADWARYHIDSDLMLSQAATETLRDWCLEHLGGDKLNGGVALVHQADGTFKVHGGTYDDEGVARAQRTRRHLRLLRQGQTSCGMLLEAAEGHTPEWWTMHIEIAMPNGTLGTSRSFRRAGTAAADWPLVPRNLFL